jgi:hypothetical protein
MTSGPTDYPDAWKPRGAPQAPSPTEPPTAPAEAIALAIDSYISALSPQEFDQLIQRTRP